MTAQPPSSMPSSSAGSEWNEHDLLSPPPSRWRVRSAWYRVQSAREHQMMLCSRLPGLDRPWGEHRILWVSTRQLSAPAGLDGVPCGAYPCPGLSPAFREKYKERRRTRSLTPLTAVWAAGTVSLRCSIQADRALPPICLSRRGCHGIVCATSVGGIWPLSCTQARGSAGQEWPICSPESSWI